MINKTFYLILIIIFCCVISSCHNDSFIVKTNAYPLSDEFMRRNELIERVNGKYNNIQEFKDKDENRVLYIYSAPIEYSKNKINKINNGYEANGNYVIKEFPEMLSKQSSLLVYNTDNKFELCVMSDEKHNSKHIKSKNVFNQTLDSVTYLNVFGDGINFICYPTSFGLNSEIVIPKDMNQYVFEFQFKSLETLSVDTTSPDYIILRNMFNNNVKAIIYTPILVDNNGKWCYDNSVTLIKEERNIYVLKFNINKSFLKDHNTKFPVAMNQSIAIYIPKQPDTSSYSKRSETESFYLSPYMILGDNTTKGEGWSYIRYDVLNNLGLDPDKVISAEYIFHNLFNLNNEVIVSAYAVTSGWCSINTSWYNRPAFDNVAVCSTKIKSAGDYKLDITLLMKEMLKNEGNKYLVENSFLIKSDTVNTNLIIASGDNGLYSPYIKLVIKN